MDIGIQLSMKVGEVLINVYEPDRTKLEEAVSDLKLLHTKMGAIFAPKEEVPFVTNPEREQVAPPYSATPPPPNTGAQFCAKCGAPKRWIVFKEPRENPWKPGEMQDGFMGCSANCGKK